MNVLVDRRGEKQMRVVGLTECTSFQFGNKLYSHRAVNSRLACSRPAAFEQCLHPLGYDLVAIGKNRLATNAGNLHDLRNGVFMLTDEPPYQQTLARPVGLRACPVFFDL